MPLWKIRSRTNPAAVNELQPELLKILIDSGGLSADHELLPPAWTTWLPLAEGKQFLASMSTAAPMGEAPSPATPVAPEVRATARRAPVAEQKPANPAPVPGRAPAEVSPKAAPADSARLPEPCLEFESAPLAVKSASPAPKAPQASVLKSANRSQVSGRTAHAKLEGLTQPVRRRRAPLVEADDEELEMTPMIDMTFLLLIFFMVTSSVSAMGRLELPNSTSGDSDDPKKRVVLVLDFDDAARPTDDARFAGSHLVSEDGIRMFLSDQPDRFLTFAELEGALKSEFAGRSDPMFVLQAHRRMPARLVRQAITAAERAGSKASMVGVSVAR